MFKELIVAITLGALLGFGITGGFFAVKKNSQPKTNITNAPSPIISTTISPTPTILTTQDLSTKNHSLTIDSPENNFLSTASRVTIKGLTSPDSRVFASTGTNIYDSKSDSAGNYEIDIDLESGINLVKVESISPQDEQTKSEIYITYSTAKI